MEKTNKKKRVYFTGYVMAVPLLFLLLFCLSKIAMTSAYDVVIEGQISLNQNFEPTYTTDRTRTTSCQPKPIGRQGMEITPPSDHHKRLRHGKNKHRTSDATIETATYDETTTVSTDSGSRHKKHKSKRHHPSNNSMPKNFSIPKIRPTPTTSTEPDIFGLLSQLGINLSPNITYQTTTDTVTEAPKATQFEKHKRHGKKKSNKFHHPHYVREDLKLQNFSLNIFQRSMSVFDSIKGRLDSSKLKKKVDLISQSYRDKFAEFVNETLYQKIITDYGTQKVILNTIETSNKMMKKLFSFLEEDLVNNNVLRVNDGMDHALRNDIDNVEQQEYVQACLAFNICRSKRVFSNFVVDILSMLLQADDKHFKQGFDALTEVLKDTQFDFDTNVENAIKYTIKHIDYLESDVLKPAVAQIRNLIANKNKPLVVQNSIDVVTVNKSIAVMDFIDLLDDTIPTNTENTAEWVAIKVSLSQWIHGKRTDILDIMKRITHQFVDQGLSNMNSKHARNIQNTLKTMLQKYS